MNRKYIVAKQKVRSIKFFYIHLFLFLIVNMGLLLKLILLEKDESLNFFVWIVLNIMVTWSIGVIVHAWIVFKGKIIFSKAYEDVKIQALVNEDQTE